MRRRRFGGRRLLKFIRSRGGWRLNDLSPKRQFSVHLFCSFTNWCLLMIPWVVLSLIYGLEYN